MKQRTSKIIKAVVFTAIGVAILAVVNFIVLPNWSVYNYNSAYGFYEQPKDTIETLFIGSSHVRNGISPTQLYEDYGICAYDLSTDAQPVAASYFWIKEVYHRQSETLDTVVLDVGTMKLSSGGSYYHIAIDPMRFSVNKIRAVRSYSPTFTEFVYNLFPIFSYHDRWKELEQEDFESFGREPDMYLRGYWHSVTQWIDEIAEYTDLITPLRVLDEHAPDTQLDEKALDYFGQIVEFCEGHGLRLVLIKTPTTAWTSSDHNAVQTLADVYGLDFMDFNIEPYYSDINFNMATDVIVPDNVENMHLNHFGAESLTAYFGTYLVDVCGNRDVRGEERYAFLEEELEDYHRCIQVDTFKEFTDPCDYIAYALEQGDYTVFLSVKDEAASALTEDQRAYFASIGLTQLADLSYRDSYLAVIENGEVVVEMSQSDPGEGSPGGQVLAYKGTLPDGTAYTVTGGGRNMGNQATVTIDGEQEADNTRGLNIVLYDNRRGEYVANAVFDTCMASERPIQNIAERLATDLGEGVTLAEMSGTERALYLYNRACENEKTVKTLQYQTDGCGLYEYLTAFWYDADMEIYITVRGDAAAVLTEEQRAEVRELGLAELAEIGPQDAYLAQISGGDVVVEERGPGENGLEYGTPSHKLRSRASNGDSASVMIDGTEYASEEDGIQLVIYDNLTESVVVSMTFEPSPEGEAGEVFG